MARSINVSGITDELIFIDTAFEISINHGNDKMQECFENAIKIFLF